MCLLFSKESSKLYCEVFRDCLCVTIVLVARSCVDWSFFRALEALEADFSKASKISDTFEFTAVVWGRTKVDIRTIGNEHKWKGAQLLASALFTLVTTSSISVSTDSRLGL